MAVNVQSNVDKVIKSRWRLEALGDRASIHINGSSLTK